MSVSDMTRYAQFTLEVWCIGQYEGIGVRECDNVNVEPVEIMLSPSAVVAIAKRFGTRCIAPSNGLQIMAIDVHSVTQQA